MQVAPPLDKVSEHTPQGGTLVATEKQPLLRNDAPPQRAAQQFFSQLAVTMKRQLIQKKRSIAGCLVETLLPALFMAGLVVASLASDIVPHAAEQYVPPPPTPPENVSSLIRGSVCYNNTPPVAELADLIDPCPNGFGVAFTCDDPTRSLGYITNPIPGLCIMTPVAYMLAVWLDNFTTTRDLVPFDDFVLMQLGTRVVFGFVQKPPLFQTNTVKSALQHSGLIYVVPQNAQTEAMVGYFNTTYKLFRHLFGGYFPTRAAAEDVLGSVNGEGKAWAVIQIFSMSAADGFHYEIGLNKSAIPWTNMVRNRFGHDTSGPKLYYASGFLTLQHILTQYYHTSAAHRSTAGRRRCPDAHCRVQRIRFP